LADNDDRLAGPADFADKIEVRHHAGDSRFAEIET